MGDGDEGDTLVIEHLDDLREVSERTCQAVNLVDDHDVDLSVSDILQHSLKREIDYSLINLIGRANYLLARLTDGSCSSIKGLAGTLDIHPADISRILPLAFLAPSIVEQILSGSQPGTLSPAYLRRGIDIPACWSEQRAAILQKSNRTSFCNTIGTQPRRIVAAA